jgi:hypothetical protein
MKTRDINRKPLRGKTGKRNGDIIKGRMRRKEEEEVHLSIYRQPSGRGERRQQLSADVKCQKGNNEMKPLLRGPWHFRNVPRAALPSGCEELQRELNRTKCTAVQWTYIPSRYSAKQAPWFIT